MNEAVRALCALTASSRALDFDFGFAIETDAFRSQIPNPGSELFEGTSHVYEFTSNNKYRAGSAHKSGAGTCGLFQDCDRSADSESDRNATRIVKPFPANGSAPGGAEKNRFAGRFPVGVSHLGFPRHCNA